MPRIILSWACYWIGDGVSRIVEPIFGKWFEWPYRLYNKFMCWSDDLQGNDPRGPWSPIVNESPMLMSDDDAPDWPPAGSARDAKEGEIRHGSIGQTWQARNGQWVRIKKPALVQTEQQKS